MFNELIIFFYLLAVTVIDVKTHNIKNKGIPSFLTTLFLLTAIIVNPPSIVILAIASLLALLLFEINWYEGLADLKILIALSILLGSPILIFSFIVTMVILTQITAYVIGRKTSYPYLVILMASYYFIYGFQYMGLLK